MEVLNRVAVVAILFALVSVIWFGVGFNRTTGTEVAGICDDAIEGVPESLHEEYLDRCWEEVLDR